MSSPLPATESELSTDKVLGLGDTPSSDATPSLVTDPSAAEVKFPGKMPSLDLEDNPSQEEADPFAALANGPAAKTASGKIPSGLGDTPSADATPSLLKDPSAAEVTFPGKMPSLDLEDNPSQEEANPFAALVNGPAAAAAKTASGKMPSLDLEENPSAAAVKGPAAAKTSQEKMPSLDLEKPSQKQPPSTAAAVNGLATAEETSSGNVPSLDLMEKPYQKELSEGTIPREEQAMGKASLAKKLLSADPPARIKRPSRILGVPDPNGIILFMAIASLLYSMVAMWLLHLVSDQPAAFVWIASQLAIIFFTIGRLCMSTTRFFIIFLQISYVELLSVAATHFIGTISGAAVATILSFYCAGMFGNALAEYLQRNKIKESASEALPSSGAEQKEESIWSFILMHGMMSFVVILRMAFLVLYPTSVLFFIAIKDHVKIPLFIVEEISLEMLFLSLPCCCFVSLILEKETISSSMMLCKIPSWVVVFYILSTIFSVVLGEVASVLILWPVAMAVVGLFGYILAMCGHAKKISKR
ncbi:hypothetical protein EJB05_29445, partial [Eragrostis curvula]